ncbi:MAG: HIT domain-containing protein [SAR202 cluster bacterium]|nr:HIT domain-containing protein [SAR202 cluster bacterium]
MAQHCEFCEIVARRAPAAIRYEDDEVMAFHNRLTWVPVMLLIVPRRHLDQRQFWLSPLFAMAAQVAVRLGDTDCPNGYRLVSNFGEDALQTQAHGHLHVIGGAGLGLYIDFPGKGDFWLHMYGGHRELE